METFQSIMYAVLPIVGILIGATLQYLFSRFSEKQKRQQDLRTQAYVDFLRGITSVAIAQRNKDKDKDKEQEFTILVTDAKAKLQFMEVKKSLKQLLISGVLERILTLPRE